MIKKNIKSKEIEVVINIVNKPFYSTLQMFRLGLKVYNVYNLLCINVNIFRILSIYYVSDGFI